MDDLPNVIIIIVDTLRKDYAKPLEDGLTKIGFVSYENAIAPAPWTIPSHASIFTGLYPAFHGAHETKNKKIPHVRLVKTDNLITFRLKELGYENILLTANFFVHPQFGFMGFDHVYYIPPVLEPSLLSKTEKESLQKIIEENKNDLIGITKSLLHDKQYKLFIKGSIQYLVSKFYRYFSAIFKNWPTEKGITQIIDYLDKYLKKRGELRRSNNFIFINLIEMHEPYFVHDDLKILSEHLKTNILDMDVAAKWRIKYDNEVIYVTKKIINLIEVLKKHKIFDNSLIIVTSDHGQLLGEHRRIGHGNFLYDELLRVPLLIKYPKDAPITSKSIGNFQTWISLTCLKYFILSLIEGHSKSDELLFTDIAFSESYGIAGKVSWLTEKEKKNIEQLEKYRIAVYYKNFKGIFNVEEWRFEEIISYDPKTEISENIMNHMKKEVLKFLKTATVAKVPKIKI